MPKTSDRCPRCAGPLFMQSERGVYGWEDVPTCLWCSYQVYARPAMSLAEIAADLVAEARSMASSKRPSMGVER